MKSNSGNLRKQQQKMPFTYWKGWKNNQGFLGFERFTKDLFYSVNLKMYILLKVGIWTPEIHGRKKKKDTSRLLEELWVDEGWTSQVCFVSKEAKC